jgi:hypothetical protein
MLEQLVTLSTILLTISLATERLIAIIKTIFPKLAEENKNDNGMVDPERDKRRKLLVQSISFLAGWLTASLLAPKFNPLFGHIKLNDDLNLHVIIIGFLSMGGSAFWSNVLGYMKAVKDIHQQQKALKDTEIKMEMEKIVRVN